MPLGILRYSFLDAYKRTVVEFINTQGLHLRSLRLVVRALALEFVGLTKGNPTYNLFYDFRCVSPLLAWHSYNGGINFTVTLDAHRYGKRAHVCAPLLVIHPMRCVTLRQRWHAPNSGLHSWRLTMDRLPGNDTIFWCLYLLRTSW